MPLATHCPLRRELVSQRSLVPLVGGAPSRWFFPGGPQFGGTRILIHSSCDGPDTMFDIFVPSPARLLPATSITGFVPEVPGPNRRSSTGFSVFAQRNHLTNMSWRACRLQVAGCVLQGSKCSSCGLYPGTFPVPCSQHTGKRHPGFRIQWHLRRDTLTHQLFVLGSR